MNKALIIGNLGVDPETSEVGDSTVTNFTVATNESYTNKSGERVERAEWHKIVVWGKQAETCAQYLSKGSKVAIEGSIHTRSYENKDGETKYVTEIKAQRVEFLSTKGDSSQDQSSPRRGRRKKSTATDFPVNA